jgi:ribonuclease HII
MLQLSYQNLLLEAGCDEAGRGCYAGPVFAAAVILPKTFNNALLNDSKKLNKKNRAALRTIIENEAMSFAVAQISEAEIDATNILKASIKAMHKAIANLTIQAHFLAIDGNRFYDYKNIPHTTIIKGDGKYQNIAAASILAKTYRDDYMNTIHEMFPMYDWNNNKGYGTLAHRNAILKHGLCKHHRKSFNIAPTQLDLF